MYSLKNELKEYRQKFSEELDRILLYWIRFSVEKDGRGFYGAVDLDGVPDPKAHKSSVLNARILWTFSAAAIINGRSDCAEMADRAYRVITEDFADTLYG